MYGIQGEPPPPTLKVCMNRAGGFRNDMSVCLTGLDIEAKAKLVEEAFWKACPLRARGLRPGDDAPHAHRQAGPRDQRRGGRDLQHLA